MPILYLLLQLKYYTNYNLNNVVLLIKCWIKVKIIYIKHGRFCFEGFWYHMVICNLVVWGSEVYANLKKRHETLYI